MNTRIAAVAAAAALAPLAQAQFFSAQDRDDCIEACGDSFLPATSAYGLCVADCQARFFQSITDFADALQLAPVWPWPFPPDAAFRVDFEDRFIDPTPTPMIVIDPSDPILGVGAIDFSQLRANLPITPDLLFGPLATDLLTITPAAQLGWELVSATITTPDGLNLTVLPQFEPTGTGLYFHLDFGDDLADLPERTALRLNLTIFSPGFQFTDANTLDIAAVIFLSPQAAADLAPPFGVTDLADVDTFIGGFLNQDPVADLAQPFSVYDLADVDGFISAFLAQ